MLSLENPNRVPPERNTQQELESKRFKGPPPLRLVVCSSEVPSPCVVMCLLFVCKDWLVSFKTCLSGGYYSSGSRSVGFQNYVLFFCFFLMGAVYLRVGSFARRVRNHYDGQSCRTNWGRGGRSWSGSVSTTGPPARKRGFVVRIGVGIGSSRSSRSSRHSRGKLEVGKLEVGIGK